MTAPAEVVVDGSAEDLATDVAERLLAALVSAQARNGTASLGLTGGGILEQVFTAVAQAPARGTVEWSNVSVFWGDERFVAADSPERNDGPARRLLLDHLDLDPARIHPMPATDGPDGDDVDAAARRYADLLRSCVEADHRNVDDVLAMDVILVGIGPDGHCCSLFPDQAGVHEEELSVVGVRNSPKPPPNRLSLTFRALEAADEVWVIASGESKAQAVADALGGAARVHVPSAGARGTRRTLWLLDEAAAALYQGQ